MLKSVVRTMNQWRTRINDNQQSLTISERELFLKRQEEAKELFETAELLNAPARRTFWGQEALRAWREGRADDASLFSSFAR